MVKVPDPGARIKVTVDTHNDTVEHVGLVLPPQQKGTCPSNSTTATTFPTPSTTSKPGKNAPMKPTDPLPNLTLR